MQNVTRYKQTKTAIQQSGLMPGDPQPRRLLSTHVKDEETEGYMFRIPESPDFENSLALPQSPRS